MQVDVEDTANYSRKMVTKLPVVPSTKQRLRRDHGPHPQPQQNARVLFENRPALYFVITVHIYYCL